MKYNRVLLKLSGEALMGNLQYGIDPKILEQYAKDVKQVVDAGVQVAIVIGGGNIFRGVQGVAGGLVERAQGDAARWVRPHAKVDRRARCGAL